MLGVAVLAGSLSLVDIVAAQGGGFWNWYFLPQFPMLIAFYVAGIAEVKRIPFDLPEGESEIVGGFMVEYSGMTWALIQASEFALMGLMSAIGATLVKCQSSFFVVGKPRRLKCSNAFLRSTWAAG